MTAWLKNGVGSGGQSIDVTAKYAGMSLQQAEDALRKIGSHEEAVVFDKNMKVIAAYSGGSGSVALPSSLKKTEGITVTHNHPPGNADYGATLSPADVSWFASSRAAEIRAVGRGQGEHVYSLQVRGRQSAVKTKYAKTQLNLWANQVARDATPKGSGGTGRLQNEYRKLYNGYRKQGKSKSAARHAAWQRATGEIEASLTRKVAELGSSSGAIYYSKNKRYKVNR